MWSVAEDPICRELPLSVEIVHRERRGSRKCHGYGGHPESIPLIPGDASIRGQRCSMPLPKVARDCESGGVDRINRHNTYVVLVQIGFNVA